MVIASVGSRRFLALTFALSWLTSACAQPPPPRPTLGPVVTATAAVRPIATPTALQTSDVTATSEPPNTATSVPLTAPVATPSALVAPSSSPTPSPSTANLDSATAAYRKLAAAPTPFPPSHLAQVQGAFNSAITAFAQSGHAADPAAQRQLVSDLSVDGARPPMILTADLSGDGRSDLIVAAPVPGLMPLLVLGGQTTPQPLLPDLLGPDVITSLVQTVDLRGHAAAIVVTQTTLGASSTNTDVVVIGQSGQHSQVLFDESISDWAGPASWKILPDSSIQLQCPAFGVYDHKLLPHPSQLTRYAWSGSAYVLAERRTDPPSSRREMMNLAERDFFIGDWSRAVPHYQAIVDGSGLSDEPGDKVDWVDFARFRLGEIAALQGDRSTAERWLGEAGKAPAPLGTEANAFLQEYRSGGAADGFAAIQGSNLPVLFQSGQMGNLDFPVTLDDFGALGIGVAAYLDEALGARPPSTAEITAGLDKMGFRALDLTVGDLNGDGAAEIAGVLPFGVRGQDLWLFVRESGHWHAINALQAPNGLAGIQTLPDHHQAINVKNPPGSSPPTILLTWNGHDVATLASPTAAPVPISTSYLPGGSCMVAENFPS
ncbi:MAG TPA: hypothetical protein VMW65_12755 [Chloroflexota bacterium]|nr:hypothetical protein [Chloroflexota bacterium]